MTAKTSSALVFPACVAVVVGVALAQPALFGTYAGFDLKRLIIPLIQIIMFGMGATLSMDDFLRVARMPKPVVLGFFAQYMIMPTVSWIIALAFGFESEIAAGFILVGCVSGGVASNVITYLAKGNVPLSVTMTLCSTLACPFMTPLLMKLLAGKLIPIDVLAMMLSIANMIILPVAVGLLANLIFFGKSTWNRRRGPLLALAMINAIVAFILFKANIAKPAIAEVVLGLALGAVFIAVMSFAKCWYNVHLRQEDDWLNRILPIVSMAGICLIIGIITSRARSQLLSVGLALLGASLLLNAIGYLLGYWSARAVRLNEVDSRTVAIEVGMQNAGMATGIAMNVLNSAAAALGSVVYGPLMNVTGALLAGYWQRKPILRTAENSSLAIPSTETKSI
jgi:BASS family bile acid:Na+ symporter